jgi:hypothetical protein
MSAVSPTLGVLRYIGAECNRGSDSPWLVLARSIIFGRSQIALGSRSLGNGGNNNVAAPSISSASYSGGTLMVSGTYSAPVANVSYVIQFFASPSSGEGAVYIGMATVTPTSTGTHSFTFTTATTAVIANPIITATITDSSGDSSEFSLGISV